MDEVKREARRRKIDLIIGPTDEAIKAFARNPKDTNALLHVGRVLMRRQLRRAQVLSFTTARTPIEVSR